MEIRLFLNDLKEMSLGDLENVLNVEVKKRQPSMSKIISVCVVLVRRCGDLLTLPNIDDKVLVDIIMTLSVYVEGRRKNVSIKHLMKLIRQEVDTLCRYRSTSIVFDSEEYGFYLTQGDLESLSEKLRVTSVEKEVYMARVMESSVNSLPKNLRPVALYFLQTGVLADNLLETVDKLQVRKLLLEIGVYNMLNYEKISEEIPKDPHERVVFLSILAHNHPEIFVILCEVQEVSKVLMMSEILDSVSSVETIKFPSSEDVIQAVMDSSSAAKNIVHNKFTAVENRYLSNLMRDTKDTGEVAITLIEYLKKFMDVEYNNYNKSLDRLAERVTFSKAESAAYFRLIGNEIQNTMNIYDKLRREI